MAIRIDGAALAAKLKAQIREEAAALSRPPSLAVVLAPSAASGAGPSISRPGPLRRSC